MKKNTTVYIVLLLVSLITVAAFTLSFRTVRDVGDSFFSGFGWLFAIMIDLGMVVLGLVRLQADLLNQDSIKRWAKWGLLAALVASFVLNVVTNDGRFKAEWLHWLVHGLPPVALLALSELAMQIFDASRQTAVSPYDKLKARLNVIIPRWRKQMARRRQELAKLRQELDTATSERDAAMADARQELAKLRQELDTATSERDAAMAELAKLKKRLDKDYVHLETLPERLAYVASEMSQGRVPNGDFAQRFGVGESMVERTMSTLWPKQDRQPA